MKGTLKRVLFCYKIKKTSVDKRNYKVYYSHIGNSKQANEKEKDMTLKEKYDLIINERNKLVALERELKTFTIVDTMYPSAVVMNKKEFEELADCLGVDLVATVPFKDEFAQHNQMTYFIYHGVRFMHFFKGVEA